MPTFPSVCLTQYYVDHWVLWYFVGLLMYNLSPPSGPAYYCSRRKGQRENKYYAVQLGDVNESDQAEITLSFLGYLGVATLLGWTDITGKSKQCKSALTTELNFALSDWLMREQPSAKSVKIRRSTYFLTIWLLLHISNRTYSEVSALINSQ